MTAAGTLLHALTARDARRIGCASPYVPAINDMAVSFLAGMGFEAIARAGVDTAPGNHAQGAPDPNAIYTLGLRANSAVSDVIVL